jgi:hypothetical protein
MADVGHNQWADLMIVNVADLMIVLYRLMAIRRRV